MNEILELVGTVCICGAFYLIAKKKADEVEVLEKCLTRSEYREDRLLKENIELSKTIEKCESMEAKQVKEFIEMQKEIDGLKADKKELGETILFDNDVMIQKTEKIERLEKLMVNEDKSKRTIIINLKEKIKKGCDHFAKDQITIADLNQQLCDANYKVVELECEMDSMVHRGWRKIMRARRVM